MNKLIYFLYIHDSHYRAVQFLAGYLSAHGHTVRMVDIGMHFTQNTSQPIEKLESGSVVITAIGGEKLRKIFSYLKSRDIKIVSLFPGIVHHSKLEDLLGKWFSDLVLVNSLKDKKIYSLFCKLHGLEDNSHLFGCSWVDFKKQELWDSSENYFVFIEQLGVPKTADEAAHLLDQLDALAKRTEKKCVIKLRGSEGMSAPKTGGKSLEAVFDRRCYQNIFLSSEDIDKLLSKANFVVGVSSSALLQAILMKKPTFVISDFGRRNYYVDFFQGSKVVHKLKDIPVKSNLDPRWVRWNCTSPLATIDYVYGRIINLKNNKLKLKSDYIRMIALVIYCLFLYRDFRFIPRFVRSYFKVVKPITWD